MAALSALGMLKENLIKELLRFAKRYYEKRGHEYIYWNLSDIDSL